MGKYLGLVERREQSTPTSVWCAVVDEVAALWNTRFVGSDNPPWPDEEWDVEQQRRIGEAIRRGDLERCADLMARWKVMWEEAMANTACGSLW